MVARIMPDVPSALQPRSHALNAWLLAGIGGVMLAIFAAALLHIGGTEQTLRSLLGLACGGTVIVLSGLVILIALGVLGGDRPSSSQLSLAIVVGSVATSVFLEIGWLLTDARASVMFAWWSLLTVAAGGSVALVGRRSLRVTRDDFHEVLSIAIVLVTVAFWCRQSAALLPTMLATGRAPVWSDYFIHATEIAQFGDPLASGRGSFLLVGEPIGLYHFGSYMIAATAEGLIKVPALTLTASLWLPYGMLLAALGAGALGRTLAGPVAGLLAPIALLLVPDASTYGAANGLFGFHWLLCAAPGSGYGLGVAFAALALIARWRANPEGTIGLVNQLDVRDYPRGQRGSLWLGVLLAGALFQFRAHVFVLFVPALVTTLLWESAFARRHVRAIAMAGVAATILVVVSLVVIERSQETWRPLTTLMQFLQSAHQQVPSAYDGLFDAVTQRVGSGAAEILGLAALVPVLLGGLTLFYPAALVLATRRLGAQPLDTFPIWCIAGWLALVVLAPTPAHGDITEYRHRPMVLVYAAVFLWTCVALFRMIGARSTSARRARASAGDEEHSSPSRAPAPASAPAPATKLAAEPRFAIVMIALIVGALGITAWMRRDWDPARPRFAWAPRYFDTTVDRGLLDAAAFLRHRAVPGDTLAVIPVEPYAQLDTAVQLAALSDVPTYLARPVIQAVQSPARRQIVDQRIADLRRIGDAPDTDAAFNLLRRLGITFLVTRGNPGPHFDPNRSHALFRTADIAIYHVTPSSATSTEPSGR